MSSPNFAERFAAFAQEAQMHKDVLDVELRHHLAAADAVVDRMRALGVGVRIELPMGVDVKLVQLRVLASLSVKLA